MIRVIKNIIIKHLSLAFWYFTPKMIWNIQLADTVCLFYVYTNDLYD
jgi:hypothetical protein